MAEQNAQENTLLSVLEHLKSGNEETKSSAKELGSRNITVNAIAPGYISTSMTNELKHDIKEQLKSTIPLKRLGAPEDVASLVCFLVSEEANYITGQTFNVDGGLVLI